MDRKEKLEEMERNKKEIGKLIKEEIIELIEKNMKEEKEIFEKNEYDIYEMSEEELKILLKLIKCNRERNEVFEDFIKRVSWRKEIEKDLENSTNILNKYEDEEIE